MKHTTGKQQRLRYHLPVVAGLVLILVLLLLPTGYEQAAAYTGTEQVRARVLATDESQIISTGIIQSGEQLCALEILGGSYKGTQAQGINLLTGSLESDKIYAVGDVALVTVSHRAGEILSVSMVDHYRLDKAALLAAVFALLLIAFAGITGVRAILSFALTVLAIWKVLVPLYLKGVNPVAAGLAITLVLTLLIIALVYGFDRRCLSATGGAMLGVLTTCILGVVFTNVFKIHGAIMANSETLLYSGYTNLNLTQIFTASIFVGASGAVMDLAVDITSAVGEVIEKKPGIGWREAALSGMRVGRAAMGTMTTTLLLAYSGGYVALLMVFMAQGTPLVNILNYKYVSAEILDTIVGSFGLVTVAPFTALCAGLLLTKKTP